MHWSKKDSWSKLFDMHWISRKWNVKSNSEEWWVGLHLTDLKMYVWTTESKTQYSVWIYCSRSYVRHTCTNNSNRKRGRVIVKVQSPQMHLVPRFWEAQTFVVVVVVVEWGRNDRGVQSDSVCKWKNGFVIVRVTGLPPILYLCAVVVSHGVCAKCWLRIHFAL